MSKARKAIGKPIDAEFIGFDLGHGESAVARAFAQTLGEPEILEYRSHKSFVTAVAKQEANILIGSDAVAAGASGEVEALWVKFKSRDLDDSQTRNPVRLFTQHLMQSLHSDKQIGLLSKAHFLIGCPSGWTVKDRASYKALFKDAGLKTIRIVPESRAALMTALEQGYLSIDKARRSVLIIDIGSSTTDFTLCRDLDTEDVGHNILGSGLLDSEIYAVNMARQPQRAEIEKLLARFPHYGPIMEYWCRQAKEMYFTGSETPVELVKRLPVAGGVFFEIRIDKTDADKIMSTPLEALNGFTWPAAFDYALRETLSLLAGRSPETVLLTGGASRLPLVLPACETAFPGSKIIRGAEPEFAIARGLAWLGRFDFLHNSFQESVALLLAKDGPVYAEASKASAALGPRLAPVLVDAMAEHCILPAFRDWRRGRIPSMAEVETALSIRVEDWLSSEGARQTLRPVINDWFADLQRSLETETDPLCRAHGLPAMVLSLDDNQHVSRHLEGLTVAAPSVTTLESDTALMGTTLTAVIIGALLAKANLFAPLFLNPIGLVIGGAVAGGGFLVGKKALEGRFANANVPVLARQVMTDGRIKKAVKKQRPELMSAVSDAWQKAASDRFTNELTGTLERALKERADERAALFLI